MVHGGPDRIEVVTPDLDDVLEWDVRWSSEASGRDTGEVDADVAGTRRVLTPGAPLTVGPTSFTVLVGRAV